MRRPPLRRPHARQVHCPGHRSGSERFRHYDPTPRGSGKAILQKRKTANNRSSQHDYPVGAVAGFVCQGLSRNLAFVWASRLLDCQVRDASAECIDAIGELTNMIAGNAKSEFPDEGIAISVPAVIFGPISAVFPLQCARNFYPLSNTGRRAAG